MDMRRLAVFLVISLFLIGSVFADEGSSDSSGSSGSSDSSESSDTGSSDSGSSDTTLDTIVDADVEVKDTKASVKARVAVEAKRSSDDLEDDDADEEDEDDSDEEKKGNLERMEGKLLDIRAQQRAHVEASESRCSESKNPENCKRAIENRLEAIAKLEQKDLELLEKLREKRADVEEKQKELKMKALKKFDNEGKARELAKAKREEAEQAFKQSKETFKTELEKQKADREQFVDARKDWNEKCASDKASEGCAELEVQLKTHVRGYLVHTLGSITGKLEQLKTSIQSSETLSEDEAAAALKDIEASLAVAAELTAKAEQLSAESSQEEIDALVKETRDLWDKAKHPLKMHGVKVVNSRLGGVLVKSEKMNLKLAHVLERMTEKGVDTSVVEGLVAQFNQKLTDAEASYESSQSLLKEAARLSGEKRAEKVEEAQTMMRKAHASLKEAHELLKDIHSQLKKQRQIELLAEVEADTALTVG